ncbi:invasion associated locus B family protein [Aquibium microcysteis]|uniref:invasion associated locus B family protein n=1 Tax=Aquibium microcysteis TaxID=675281 RepID=UPI00165CEE53|nr:invasion associated locus B family protein [Aquibium microcysteis]
MAETLRRQTGSTRIASLVVLTVLACLGTYAAFRAWDGTTVDARVVPAPSVTPSPPVAAPSDGSPPGPVGDAATHRRVAVSDQRSHGDWRHSCLTREDGVRACSIVQTLLHKETRSLLLSWRIVKEGRSLTSIWQTPKNVVLARGLRIDAGLPDPVMLPYQGCNANNCVASIRLPDDLVNGLKTVPGLAVTISLADGQTLRLPISTRGLAAAIEDLRADGDAR